MSTKPHDSKTWRSPFYLFGGLTFLCFLGGLISIDDDVPSREADKRIDWLGAFLATGGLIFIIFILGQGKNASQGWATPCTSCSICLAEPKHSLGLFIDFPDIIALFVLGATMIGLFLYWQHYLERIYNTPNCPYFSLLTPPPLMKLSIWTRINGRIAAMMMIVFMNWSAFSSWSFWVHVRLFLMLS